MSETYYEPKDLEDFANIGEYATEAGDTLAHATQMRKILNYRRPQAVIGLYLIDLFP